MVLLGARNRSTKRKRKLTHYIPYEGVELMKVSKVSLAEFQNSDEVDVWSYLRILYRSRTLVLSGTLVISFLAFGVSLILPKQFKATALISSKIPGASQTISPLSAIKGVAGNLLGSSAESDNDSLLGLTKSRRILDHLIGRFLFDEKLKTKNRDETRKLLSKKIEAEETAEGFVEITFEYTDPVIARDVVNEIVAQLNELKIKLKIFGASNERIFLENRLQEVSINLSDVEERLKIFQEKNHIVEVESQASEAIKLVSGLYSEMIAARTEMGVKKKYTSVDSPDVVRLQMTVDELESQISDIYKGDRSIRNENNKINETSIILPLERTPELSLLYMRLRRDIEIQTKVYALIIEQLELAKINEAKTTPTITVIDEAVTPIVKSKPKIMIIVLLSTGAGLFLMIAFVLARNFWPDFKKALTEGSGSQS